MGLTLRSKARYTLYVQEQSASSLLVHGGRGSCSPGMSADPVSRWYVAQTQPHAETKASLHLRRQGFGVYFPRYRKQRRHARRVEKIAAPLFPGYVFVAIDTATQRWLSINSTVGVARLVRDGDYPAPVPQHVIDALKHREDADGFVQLDRRPRFSPGDKIRVVGGAFCDSVGLYEGLSSRERVAILLELLGRKVRIVLGTEIIEAA
jgi:transcriptional antiterminator RfaH